MSFSLKIFVKAQQRQVSPAYQVEIQTMSEQIGGLLQIPSSYHFEREKLGTYRNKSIDYSNFKLWDASQTFKSTYAERQSNKSLEPKNSVIPGYAGYLPGVRSQNLYGKGKTPMSKDIFSNQKLGKNMTGLASTGFNITKDLLIDFSKNGSTSKYGKSALQRAHPGWSDKWQTTTRSFFQNPEVHGNPSYRETDKNLQIMNHASRRSGFSANAQYLDGQGWKPDPILMGDNHRSEYRDRFNSKMQFHRNTEIVRARKLAKKEMNYSYM